MLAARDQHRLALPALEKASPRWRYIHTHFGIGYRFAAETVDAPEAEPAAAQVPLAEPEPAPPVVVPA